ncbi:MULTISPECIES: transposase family protein [Rhizobium]|uniref:transposase family protein n=1 Tax=Rhizobium leguminosarum TaxID=384 RepID=UPI0021BC1A2D|nr:MULTISPECIES: transposase family protein [Rhizobium]
MSTKFHPSDLVPAGFIAERITHIDDETCILLTRAGATALCPACGRMSRTVRSRYCRQVADLPLSGRRVRLLVRTRRFTCDAVLCGRQIPGVTGCEGRRRKRAVPSLCAQRQFRFLLGQLQYRPGAVILSSFDGDPDVFAKQSEPFEVTIGAVAE